VRGDVVGGGCVDGALEGVTTAHGAAIDYQAPAPYRRSVSDYLPAIYMRVREQYPEVAGALDQLARVSDGAGPLDDRSCRLVKLGIAIGALAEGAVRSNARRALDTGLTPDEIRHAAVLAITTRGFPAAVAALGWIEETLGPDP
jgi:4-carboxymuconolactone decarboxylase